MEPLEWGLVGLGAALIGGGAIVVASQANSQPKGGGPSGTSVNTISVTPGSAQTMPTPAAGSMVAVSFPSGSKNQAATTGVNAAGFMHVLNVPNSFMYVLNPLNMVIGNATVPKPVIVTFAWADSTGAAQSATVTFT
jgi:hypothetical protein